MTASQSGRKTKPRSKIASTLARPVENDGGIAARYRRRAAEEIDFFGRTVVSPVDNQGWARGMVVRRAKEIAVERGVGIRYGDPLGWRAHQRGRGFKRGAMAAIGFDGAWGERRADQKSIGSAEVIRCPQIGRSRTDETTARSARFPLREHAPSQAAPCLEPVLGVRVANLARRGKAFADLGAAAGTVTYRS